MTTKDKVCRNCKRFVTETVCPVCRESNFSRSWKGIVSIIDPNTSEIAKVLDIKAPGKYCLWVK
jgi:DNA-directed RNA polymerase subunit E"